MRMQSRFSACLIGRCCAGSVLRDVIGTYLHWQPSFRQPRGRRRTTITDRIYHSPTLQPHPAWPRSLEIHGIPLSPKIARQGPTKLCQASRLLVLSWGVFRAGRCDEGCPWSLPETEALVALWHCLWGLSSSTRHRTRCLSPEPRQPSQPNRHPRRRKGIAYGRPSLQSVEWSPRPGWIATSDNRPVLRLVHHNPFRYPGSPQGDQRVATCWKGLRLVLVVVREDS